MNSFKRKERPLEREKTGRKRHRGKGKLSKLLKYLEKKTTETHYDVLQVSQTEKIDAIVRSYRNKAMLLHEDKISRLDQRTQDRAKEGFRRISESYHTLIDKYKRAEYDHQLLEKSFSENTTSSLTKEEAEKFSTSNLTNIFVTPKCKIIEKNLTVGPKIVFQGGIDIPVKIDKKQKCVLCKGVGSNLGTAKICPKCNGCGMVIRRICKSSLTENASEKGTSINFSQKCAKCYSTGIVRVIKGKECKNCDTKGYYIESKTLRINIPPGIPINKNTYFTLKDQGNEEIHKQPGDVRICVNVEWNQNFVVVRKDIHIILNISLYDSICGFTYKRDWFGTELMVSSNGNDSGPINSGEFICIENTGLPEYKPNITPDQYKTIQRGNLYVQFHVQMPKFVSKEDKQIFKILLKKTSKDPKIEKVNQNET